jgi:hypothetical protein
MWQCFPSACSVDSLALLHSRTHTHRHHCGRQKQREKQCSDSECDAAQREGGRLGPPGVASNPPLPPPLHWARAGQCPQQLSKPPLWCSRPPACPPARPLASLRRSPRPATDGSRIDPGDPGVFSLTAGSPRDDVWIEGGQAYMQAGGRRRVGDGCVRESAGHCWEYLRRRDCLKNWSINIRKPSTLL